MASQPTPEEAADALREVTERRQQATNLAAYPKWAPWVLGALIIIVGVSSDVAPDLRTPMSYLLLAGALALAFLPRLKRVGSAMGYRHSPASHPVGMPARTRVLNRVVLIAAIILFFALSRLFQIWEVPYPSTIFSVFIVATIPLWQRLLGRGPRETKLANHG